MKKYYIEIVDPTKQNPYEIQSRWFNTEEQALEWAKTIDYCGLTMCLMSAVFDEYGRYEDIKFEKYLN